MGELYLCQVTGLIWHQYVFIEIPGELHKGSLEGILQGIEKASCTVLLRKLLNPITREKGRYWIILDYFQWQKYFYSICAWK